MNFRKWETFYVIKKLKCTIEDELYKINPEFRKKLISSMKTRIFEVIQRNGFYISFCTFAFFLLICYFLSWPLNFYSGSNIDL